MVPAKDTISGPLGAYFKVVDRSYKINDGKVNIEIERVAEGMPAPWEEGIEVGYSDNNIEPGFTAEFMDKDGDILYKDETNIVWEADVLTTVVALAVGESISIPFSVSPKKPIAKFKVSSTFKYHESKTKSYSSTTTSSSSSTSGQFIFDEAIDEYSNALKEVQDEVEEAYKEAAKEVRDAMKDAFKDLF